MVSGQTKTVIGTLNIVGGEWTAEAPNTLAVREPPAAREREAAKGDLIVLVEMRRPAMDAHQSAARAVAETIRDSYYDSPAGVIASLRRALLDAATRPSGATSDDTPIGLLAVVVRGADVFIASAGPPVVYVVSDNRAVRFPERQPLLSGNQDPLAPFFFHTAVTAGTILVLGDSRFAASVAPEDVAPAVADCTVEDALAGLGELMAGQDSTLIAVEVEGDIPAHAETTGHRPGRGLHQGERGEPSPASLSRTDGAHRGMELPGAVVALVQRIGRSRFPQMLGYVARNLLRGALTFFILIWRGLRALFVNVLPEHSPTALHEQDRGTPTKRGQTSTTRLPERNRVDEGPDVPLSGADEDAATSHGMARSQHVLRLVAIVIPVLAVTLAGVTYWRQGVAQESTFHMLMEQAQALYQQALNADEPTARNLLDRAEQMLAEAAAIRATDAAQIELRGLVIGQQDKINRVERLDPLERLRQYDNPLTRLRRVVADGLDLYVLDSGADMVYYHRLDDTTDSLQPDETDPVVVRRAQQVGGNLVGELIDITWSPMAPDRRSGALLILGADDLLGYTANDRLDNLLLGGRDRWGQPVAAGGYGSNLYLLDPQAGQIFRYRPGSAGYPEPPETYLPADAPGDTLAGAVDMAIDGYIYVLYANGSIRKFEGGAPAPFELQGLDRALVNPTALFTAPEPQVRYVYVVDAGNRRIVQMEKDGRFIRQLKPRDGGATDFGGIRSIFVDELAGKMYFVDSSSLFVAAVPRLE